MSFINEYYNFCYNYETTSFVIPSSEWDKTPGYLHL